MELNSLSFGLFFVGTLILYWWVPKKVQWGLLLAASLYFYFSWRPAYGWVLLVTTGLTYLAALSFERFPAKKIWFLLLAIGVDLGVLFIFKYFNFFSYTLTGTLSLVSFNLNLPQFKLLLPIGISFYTFQIIGYLVDVYKGKLRAEKNFGIFALFVLFFPKFIAGPIERGSHLLPQFDELKSFDYDRTVSGLKLFTFGLFKKAVVADNLGLVVDSVFGSLTEFKGLSLILTIFFFSWQIYADFSGYTDMARGVARILGYDLLENFNHPYLATSVRDFWRRWHISLSTWLRDYLYIPLGGSRQGLLRTCLNYLIVFAICGLWHGAAWTFIVWGVLHGAIISVERIGATLVKTKWRLPTAVSILYAYAMVSLTWVFFRAASLNEAWYILRSSVMGVRNFVSPSYIWATLSQMFETNRLEMAIVGFCLAAIIGWELLSMKKQLGTLVKQQPALIRFSIYAAVVFLIVTLRIPEIKEFIYVQF